MLLADIRKIKVLLPRLCRRVLKVSFLIHFLATPNFIAFGSVLGDRSQPTVRIQVINIVPDFLRFWDASRYADEKTQVEMFRRQVVLPHSELFTSEVVGLDERQPLETQNAKIATFLRDITALIPTIKFLNARLADDLQLYGAQFLQVFPDYVPATPVYFTISMRSFDGGTREVNGKLALLFGVDEIARVYGPDAKLSVLFDHELYHQYHLQELPSFAYRRDSDERNPELWKSLWEEGLATYVSWRMNPTADENDALGDRSRTLAAHCDPIASRLAATFVAEIDSTAPFVYEKWFLGSRKDPDVPKRSGYYLGFKVVSKIGEEYSLMDLSRMEGPELRARIAACLRSMAGNADR